MDTQTMVDEGLRSSPEQRAELARGEVPAPVRLRMNLAFGAFPSRGPTLAQVAFIAGAVVIWGLPFWTPARTGFEWLAPLVGLSLISLPAYDLWKLYRQGWLERRVYAGRPRLRTLEGPVETIRTWNVALDGAFKLRGRLKFGEEQFTLGPDIGHYVISGEARLYVLCVPTFDKGLAPSLEYLVAIEALPETRVETRAPARATPRETAIRSAPAD